MGRRPTAQAAADGVHRRGGTAEDAAVAKDIAVEGETAQQVVKLLEWLEDIDDVQAVYSNAELGEDAYA